MLPRHRPVPLKQSQLASGTRQQPSRVSFFFFVFSKTVPLDFSSHLVGACQHGEGLKLIVSSAPRAARIKSLVDLHLGRACESKREREREKKKGIFRVEFGQRTCKVEAEAPLALSVPPVPPLGPMVNALHKPCFRRHGLIREAPTSLVQRLSIVILPVRLMRQVFH